MSWSGITASRSAFPTQAVQHQCRRFNLTPLLAGKDLLDLFEQRRVKLDDAVADAAAEVMMVRSLVGHRIETVLVRLALKMPGVDQPFLLQPAQRAVHRGQVERRVLGQHPMVKFLRGRVIRAFSQRSQNQTPLSGHAPTRGGQSLHSMARQRVGGSGFAVHRENDSRLIANDLQIRLFYAVSAQPVSAARHIKEGYVSRAVHASSAPLPNLSPVNLPAERD